MKYETNKSVAAKADRFAEREYVSDGYEREWLSKGYYHGYLEGQQQIVEKASKWFEDNFKDSFEEEMMSNIITEFKKAMK